MKIQDMSSLTTFTSGDIRRSPNIHVVTLFRAFRDSERISAFGDYQIISHIVNILEQSNRKLTRWEITTALNESFELSGLAKKEKSDLLNCLMDDAKVSVSKTKRLSD